MSCGVEPPIREEVRESLETPRTRQRVAGLPIWMFGFRLAFSLRAGLKAVWALPEAFEIIQRTVSPEAQSYFQRIVRASWQIWNIMESYRRSDGDLSPTPC